MDPIMMAALVISIGFSVDIPAHVSYHYHSAGLLSHLRLFEITLAPLGFENPSATVKDRLILTLSSVGFPAIQASISTNLVVLSLLFVPLYMAKVSDIHASDKRPVSFQLAISKVSLAHNFF